MDTYCNSYNTIMINDHYDCFIFVNVHMYLWLLHTYECVYAHRNSYNKIMLNDLGLCICTYDCFVLMILHMYTHHNTYNKILLNNLSWLLHDCECTCIHKLQQLQQDPWCLGYCNQHILVNSHCNTPCNKHYDTHRNTHCNTHITHVIYCNAHITNVIYCNTHITYIIQCVLQLRTLYSTHVIYCNTHITHVIQYPRHHPSYARHDSILTSDLTHSHTQQWSVEYALHACFICVTRRIESSVVRVPWVVHTCHMTQFLRVDMPHSYAWHVYWGCNDAFIYYVIDIFYVCNNSVMSTPHAHIYICTYVYICIYEW